MSEPCKMSLCAPHRGGTDGSPHSQSCKLPVTGDGKHTVELGPCQLGLDRQRRTASCTLTSGTPITNHPSVVCVYRLQIRGGVASLPHSHL